MSETSPSPSRPIPEPYQHLVGRFQPSVILGGLQYLLEIIASSRGIVGCARCLQTHQTLAWQPLTHPAVFDSHLIAGYAICPNTDEPILLSIQESDAAEADPT